MGVPGALLLAVFLLSHPGLALGEPLRRGGQILWGDAHNAGDYSHPLPFYFYGVRPPGWQKGLSAVLFATPLGLAALAALALVLLVWTLRARRGDARLLLPGALLLSALPTAFFAIHGDAMEPQRHAYLVMLTVRLGLWPAGRVSLMAGL